MVMFYHPTFTADQYDPLQSDLAWLLVYCDVMLGYVLFVACAAMAQGCVMMAKRSAGRTPANKEMVCQTM